MRGWANGTIHQVGTVVEATAGICRTDETQNQLMGAASGVEAYYVVTQVMPCSKMAPQISHHMPVCPCVVEKGQRKRRGCPGANWGQTANSNRDGDRLYSGRRPKKLVCARVTHTCPHIRFRIRPPKHLGTGRVPSTVRLGRLPHHPTICFQQGMGTGGQPTISRLECCMELSSTGHALSRSWCGEGPFKDGLGSPWVVSFWEIAFCVLVRCRCRTSASASASTGSNTPVAMTHGL